MIDSYEHSCPMGCTYCYSQKKTFHDTIKDCPSTELEDRLHQAFSSNDNLPWLNLLRLKIPIRLGFAKDPFPPNEEFERKTFQLLSLLNRYKYPFIVFTKSTYFERDEYIQLLPQQGSQVQISLSSPYDELNKVLEPQAPSIEKRLHTLKHLQEQKKDCCLRVNILPPKLLSERPYEKYLDDIFTLIKEQNLPTIINEIKLPTDRKSSPNSEIKIHDYLSKKLIDKRLVNYCYLGGHPYNHYKFYGKETHNCCHFPEQTTGTKQISCKTLLTLAPKPLPTLTHYCFQQMINFLGSQLYNEKSSS